MDPQATYTQLNELLKNLLMAQTIDVDRAQLIASDFNTIYQEPQDFVVKLTSLTKTYPELLPLIQLENVNQTVENSL